MPLSEYCSTYPVAISEKHSQRQMQRVSVQKCIYRHHLVKSHSSDDNADLQRTKDVTNNTVVLIRMSSRVINQLFKCKE